MSNLGAFSMWDLFRGEVESQMRVFTEGATRTRERRIREGAARGDDARGAFDQGGRADRTSRRGRRPRACDGGLSGRRAGRRTNA